MTHSHEQHIYTIFDSKAELFLPPFYAVNDQVAIRRCKATMRDLDHDFSQHAEDYTLFNIGKFDQVKGEIESAPPVSIGNLLPMRDDALKVKERKPFDMTGEIFPTEANKETNR